MFQYNKMNKSAYRRITNFGSNAYSPVDNPLTYCLGNTIDQKFLHGSGAITVDGQRSKHCQMYMSEYCADNWDAFCEVASKNTNTDYPNNIGKCEGFGGVACKGLNEGEILIYNTAAKKYLTSMGNCKRKYEPFDPLVPTSPLISWWVSDTCDYSGDSSCVPVYGVNSKEIDSDPVMDKILAKPIIAFEILINIYNTRKRQGTLDQLKGTKLGQFYGVNPYFKSLGGL